jgi:hypothetical protein
MKLMTAARMPLSSLNSGLLSLWLTDCKDRDWSNNFDALSLVINRGSVLCKYSANVERNCWNAAPSDRTIGSQASL